MWNFMIFFRGALTSRKKNNRTVTERNAERRKRD